MNSPSSEFLHASAYVLASELEIHGVLQSLAKEQRLIQVRAAAEASMLTTLLKIEPGNEALIFDGTSDDLLSRQMLSAKKLHFDASQDGVHVSFSTGPATACSFEEQPALRLPFPAELTRIQRRDSFRVPTPVTNPVMCTIAAAEGPITLPLEDLSTGGLAASDHAHEFDPTLGTVYSHCSIDLPGSGPVDVALRLVHVRNFERAGKQLCSLGFAFEHPHGSALTRIQRYVSTLEREALARSRGFK